MQFGMMWPETVTFEGGLYDWQKITAVFVISAKALPKNQQRFPLVSAALYIIPRTDDSPE